MNTRAWSDMAPLEQCMLFAKFCKRELIPEGRVVRGRQVAVVNGELITGYPYLDRWDPRVDLNALGEVEAAILGEGYELMISKRNRSPLVRVRIARVLSGMAPATLDVVFDMFGDSLVDVLGEAAWEFANREG